jgi:hypothetical protein
MAKKVKVNILNEMRKALRDAAAYERGKSVNLRVTRIPSQPKQDGWPRRRSEGTNLPAQRVGFTRGSSG